MPAALLADVVFRLEAQRSVLETVTATFSCAVTESASVTLASISGKAADTTFSRLVHEGVVQARLAPVDRLFGTLPLGDLSMASLCRTGCRSRRRRRLSLRPRRSTCPSSTCRGG